MKGSNEWFFLVVAVLVFLLVFTILASVEIADLLRDIRACQCEP